MKKITFLKMIKDYKFNSIFLKNLKMLLFLVAFPLIIMCVVIFFYYNSLLENEISYKYEQPLQTVSTNVDLILQEAQKLSYGISSDEYVQMYANTQKSSTSPLSFITMNKNIVNLINDFMMVSDNVESVYIYSKANEYVISDTVSSPVNEFHDKIWLDTILNNDNMPKNYICVRESSNVNIERYLSVYTTINTNYDYKTIITINVNLDKITECIDNQGIKDTVYIINKDNIIYASNKDEIQQNVEDLNFLSEINISENSSKKHKINKNHDYILLHSDYNNWAYVLKFKYHASHLNYFIILIAVFGIIVSLILTFIITKKLYKPIKNIISIYENPEKWLNAPDDNITAVDEFKIIMNNILKNYDDQKKMEIELAQRLSSLKNAQSIALITQINPHFLFNTISTIKLLSMKLTNGENDVSMLISILSDILMYSMNTTEKIVPIKDEIKITKKYLDILNIRYKNRFSFIWDIDDRILEHQIVKMALQPIIENSIEYGLKNKKTNGCISIVGKIQDDTIIIDVADNGSGMSENEIKKINENLMHDYIKENKHLGLKNVNQRIRLVFGEEYGLFLSSVPTGGLKVRFKIPKSDI